MGYSGPDPIRFTEIEGWMRLNGIELLTGEINLILEIDAVFRIALAKESEKQHAMSVEQSKPTRSARKYG